MSDNSDPVVSVVIPCNSEGRTIRQVVLSVIHALERSSWEQCEIVVIDDGSVDDTAVIAANLAASDTRVRVVMHPRRLGKSAALLAGAAAARSDWIACIDGDGQHNPGDLVELLSAAKLLIRADQPVVICGVRRRRHESWARSVTSWCANRASALAFGHDLTDMGSGMKVCRRADLLSLPYFRGMHRFLPALYHVAGGKVISVPIDVRPRPFGRSRHTTRERTATFLTGFWKVLRFRRVGHQTFPGKERAGSS